VGRVLRADLERERERDRAGERRGREAREVGRAERARALDAVERDAGNEAVREAVELEVDLTEGGDLLERRASGHEERDGEQRRGEVAETRSHRTHREGGWTAARRA